MGTLFPIVCLTGIAFWWGLSNNSIQISFSLSQWIPQVGWIEGSGVIVAVMASFLGIELAGVHISDIKDPEKTFPKAIAISVFILLITLIMGSLSVAMVIPKEDIRFADGVMQTFSVFLSSLHLSSCVPVFAFLIILGSTGGALNWLISPAKGLYQATEFGYLPPYFSKLNKFGVPSRILILQAVVVSVFCILMQLFGSINTYYWFLMSLSTSLYALMYTLLFLGAMKLGRPANSYQIPKGLRCISCLMGISACALTILVGFLPPSGVEIQNSGGYVLSILGGFFLMLLPAFGLIFYRESRKGKRNIDSFI